MTTIRFYCGQHKRRHWVTEYARLGHSAGRQSPGVPVLDPLPTPGAGWPVDTWVELRPRATARQRDRNRDALAEAEGSGTAGRLRALALASQPNPREHDPAVRAADEPFPDRATFPNRCDRCGFSVPRRAENLAPLLDGFERIAQATGGDAFDLVALASAAKRWDARARQSMP